MILETLGSLKVYGSGTFRIIFAHHWVTLDTKLIF
jgi:hypothetical protein